MDGTLADPVKPWSRVFGLVFRSARRSTPKYMIRGAGPMRLCGVPAKAARVAAGLGEEVAAVTAGAGEAALVTKPEVRPVSVPIPDPVLMLVLSRGS